MSKVSIWLGKFNSEKALNKYTEEIFQANGDIKCAFYKEFKIDFIDNQFREVAYKEPLDISFLQNASYAESFIDKIDADLAKYNSIILAYDYEYTGENTKTDNVEFYKVLDYKT